MRFGYGTGVCAEVHPEVGGGGVGAPAAGHGAGAGRAGGAVRRRQPARHRARAAHRAPPLAGLSVPLPDTGT